LNKLGIDGGDDTHRRVAAVLKYLGLAPSDWPTPAIKSWTSRPPTF
jgi:hypothetical protein